ncbi:MAG: DUF2304 family protein [Candidatus Peribacteria bacterium]|nr:MAG: DUF2304 family protein [Candidatus Peribacteria bacterium]
MRPDLLNQFGALFGLARGADLIVYDAIIILTFVYFVLINQQTKTNYQLTRLCSSQALDAFAQSEQFEKLKTISRTDTSTIGFLVRAYNESATIGVVIDEIIHAGYSKIIIVDDGSEDATYALIRRKQQEYPEKHIYVIKHLINRGGGAANKTLFQFCTQWEKYLGVERWVTFDGDGQMEITDMEKFLPYTQDSNYDVLLGSRFVSGGSSQSVVWRKAALIRIAKVITYAFSGMWISDPFIGFRMIRSNILDQIHLTSDSLTYATELVAHIKKHQVPFKEVGVQIRYTPYALFKQKYSLTKMLRISADFLYKHLFFR